MESNNVTQKVVRVYPPNYTGNTIDELNKHLSEGWSVKFISPCKTDSKGGIINDYVIEKEFNQPQQ